jgi:rifampicin phosphotransferase
MENVLHKQINPVPEGWPEAFWERDEAYFLEPVMPMLRSVFMEPINAAFAGATGEFSFPLESREFREENGWIYIASVPYRRADFPTRVKNFMEFFFDLKDVHMIRRWHQEWRPEQEKAISVFKKVNITALTDSAITQHLSSALMPFLKTSFFYQGIFEFAFVMAIGRLAAACRDVLNWPPEEIMPLLGGLSTETSEQSNRLAALAKLAAGKPEIIPLLDQANEHTLENLAAADLEFARALGEYLHDYGCRIFHHSIHLPTLQEKPEIIFRLIREQLEKSFKSQSIQNKLAQKRQETSGAAQAALVNHSAPDKERFKQAMKAAEEVYPIKEGGEYATMDVPMALVRYTLLEIGDRLVSRNLLNSRDEIFFLEMEEALNVFREGRDARDLVAQRRKERAIWQSHPGPRTFGVDGSSERLQKLPSNLQSIYMGLFWVVEQYYGFKKMQQSQSADKLEGYAASAGRYTGPVRVIRGEADFHKLQAGDVLVCPITSPSWTILFPNVGALVTDAGGVLSHPAIIAREYGIPAVVATKNATKVLSDGQIVTVDGHTGMIEIVAQKYLMSP